MENSDGRLRSSSSDCISNVQQIQSLRQRQSLGIEMPTFSEHNRKSTLFCVLTDGGD